MFSSKSAAGISASSLKKDAFAIVFRLSSTTWLNGYLPVDASGDHVYQIIDAFSLALILFLLYQVLVVRRSTYNDTDDSMSIRPMVMASLAFAALLHGSMDASPLFDTLWMTGLFCGVIAVLPHFWLQWHAEPRDGPKTGNPDEAQGTRFLGAQFVFYSSLTHGALLTCVYRYWD